MLYEKQLLFLCLVDLVIEDKMDCVSDQDAIPCQISVSVCTHTWVDPALVLLWCSKPQPTALRH